VNSDIKACCADLYASDWVRLLLGDSFHPGGLDLTERLGMLLGLDSRSRVLDLAAGRGASAVHLARVFGCQVVGVDYSPANVRAAQDTAQREGLADRIRFQQGDAEHLADFADGCFDAVVCECAYCTFPDKAAAMREIARVMRPGGRLGLSDLTLRGQLPSELAGLLAWIACIADAMPLERYVACCETVGLRMEHVEEHDHALAKLVGDIRRRLLGARVMAGLKQLELPAVEWPTVSGMARRAAQAVDEGTLGYALVIASKPAPRGAVHGRAGG
jgi:arsenite methyltransferase